MKYCLSDKLEKPNFLFLVKLNTSNHDYYLFDNFEKAMEKARVLSLSTFPLSIVYEPCIDKYGEWRLQKTYWYINGECSFEERPRMELHAKFYTDAGEWLNSEEFNANGYKIS